MGNALSTSATVKFDRNVTRQNKKSKFRVLEFTHNAAVQNIGANNSVFVTGIPAGAFILGATLSVDTVEDSAAFVSVGLAEDSAELVALSNAQVAGHYNGNQSPVYVASASNVHLSANGACDTLVATVRLMYVDTAKDSFGNVQ